MAGPPFKFGKASEENLKRVHPDLVRLAREVIKHWDSSVTDGVRTRSEQIKNIAKGVSKTMDSLHLPQTEDGKPCNAENEDEGLAWAIDFNPFPIDWTSIERGMRALAAADPTGATAEIYMFSGFVQGIAAALGIDIRAGADWDSDKDIADQSFHDLPHFEKRRPQ